MNFSVCINPMSPNLGLVPDNSTLVYYAVLTVEQSALPNLTDAFNDVVLDGPPLSVTVGDIAVTTSRPTLYKFFFVGLLSTVKHFPVFSVCFY